MSVLPLMVSGQTSDGAAGGRIVLPTLELPPPTVKIEYPGDGSTISGDVKIKVRAYGLSGSRVSSLKITIDGASDLGELVGAKSNRQGKCDILCYFNMWDTSKLKNGPHSISATAIGQDGQKTAVVSNVKVDNSAKKITTPTSTIKKGSGYGTLSISTSGLLYIGSTYVGKNNVVRKMRPGSYYLYARGPETGKVCWQKRIIITEDKATTVRVSGKVCE